MPFDPRDINHLALLLDVDGTLLDIAPTPMEVSVPRGLARTLEAVGARLGGALALVSGRPIAQLDVFFAPLKLPAIGGHGAEMRPAAGGVIATGRAAPLDPKFKQRVKDIAANYPAVLVEDKGYSIALHYRQAPDLVTALADEVRRACAPGMGPAFELLPGKSVLEIKLAGFNKGTAVRELMKHPPFSGRAPVFVGDDTTDEDAFAVLPEFNGHAMSVGRSIPGADDRFQTPADVRGWLERLAGGVAVPS